MKLAPIMATQTKAMNHSNMNELLIQALPPKSTRRSKTKERREQVASGPATPATSTAAVERPRRTAADFLLFCDIVLAYEGYPPPPGATQLSESTESADSEASSLSPPAPEKLNSKAITCFCGKPCGRRQLIKCNNCSTWIHRLCAKVQKNFKGNFVCAICRGRSVHFNS